MNQAIEEAKKMKQECYDIDVLSALDELIERLEKLPQEPTTDELLEEMVATLFYMEDGNNDWKAYKSFDCFDKYREAYWKTPREALIALKEKLSTNQS